MCEFPSWFVGPNNINLFLTNEKLNSERGMALIKYLGIRTEDLCGHGSIRYFYKIKGRDINGQYPKFEAKENTNPDYIPEEIINAIKKGKMTKVGYSDNLLTQKGRDKFKRMCFNISEDCWEKFDEDLNQKEKQILHRKINEECHQKKMAAFWKLFKTHAWKVWRT